MRNKRNAIIWTRLVGAVVLVLGYLMIANIGLPEGRPLTTLSPQGDKAQSIQNLIIPVFIIAGVVFVLVEVGLVWMVDGSGRTPEDEEGVDEPEQVHGNTRLEIGWTIVPARAARRAGGVQRADDPGDGRRRRPDRHHRHRPAVVVGVPLRPGRRRRGRHHHRQRGRHPGRSRHQLQDPVERRDPQLLDPGARRQDGRRAGPHPRAGHAGQRGRVCSRASAPSTAGSPTASCACRSRRSSRPTTTSGSSG